MADAFAITTLHVCRSPGEMKDGKVTKEAQVEIVPAGQITDLSDADYAAFEKAGAVRRPNKVDKAIAADDEDPDAVQVAAAGAAKTVKPLRP